MAKRDKDGEGPRTEVEMPKFRASPGRIGVAGVLVLLSLVSSITVKGVEFEGGATLAALAALVLLWPLIPQLFIRGGGAEFLGLKIQLNALERRSEEGVGVRVEELSADLETLRLKVESVVALDPSRALAKAPVIPTKGRERLDEAVQLYADNPETEQWDLRVAVDKRLIGTGPFDISGLLDAADRDLENREYSMALAVALGTIEPGTREDEAVEELTRLLVNRSARVRYRAARSIMRLLRRKDLEQNSRFALVEASRARANVEKMDGVRGELIGILSDFG